MVIMRIAGPCAATCNSCIRLTYAVLLVVISALIASELSSAPPLDVAALAIATGLFSTNNKFAASTTVKAC